jgi:hypothetical protein
MFHHVVWAIGLDVSNDFNAFIVRVIKFKKNYTSKVLTAVQLLDPKDEGAAMI